MNQFICLDLSRNLKLWIKLQKDLKPNFIERETAYINFAHCWRENNDTRNMNGVSMLKEISRQWRKLSLQEKDHYTPKNPRTTKEIINDFLIQNPDAHWSKQYYEKKEKEVQNLFTNWQSLNIKQKQKFQQLMECHHQSD